MWHPLHLSRGWRTMLLHLIPDFRNKEQLDKQRLPCKQTSGLCYTVKFSDKLSAVGPNFICVLFYMYFKTWIMFSGLELSHIVNKIAHTLCKEMHPC